jgi:hypothetical protein
MQSSPFACHLVHLKPKHLLQNPIVEHPQAVFLADFFKIIIYLQHAPLHLVILHACINHCFMCVLFTFFTFLPCCTLASLSLDV